MMGTRQRLKGGMEYDVIYARKQYCYLINKPKLVKYAKRRMAKRRRIEHKKKLGVEQ